ITCGRTVIQDDIPPAVFRLREGNAGKDRAGRVNPVGPHDLRIAFRVQADGAVPAREFDRSVAAGYLDAETAPRPASHVPTAEGGGRYPQVPPGCLVLWVYRGGATVVVKRLLPLAFVLEQQAEVVQRRWPSGRSAHGTLIQFDRFCE